MRTLDYQQAVLDVLDDYLETLKARKQNADEVESIKQKHSHLTIEVPDFTAEAWESFREAAKLPRSRADIPFSPRKDGVGRPVPNVVLKVPTGGGKTWLAVNGVSQIIGKYLHKNHGFVLWIVPNEAIYSQTLSNLKDRQHPYRQALDNAAAGRVRILEKDDTLDARDIDNNLCIMLLMLQSANRETQETLKMFRDRGDVHGFFPPEGEQQAHKRAIEETPNLDAYTGFLPHVKDSLGNALRIIRPVVVMDEGHRAISDLAFSTLYGFNPCFVLELTATPQDVPARSKPTPRAARYANVLVEVSGKQLDQEGMIKMPLNLDTKQTNDWRNTLNSATERLTQLTGAAETLKADTGRYIRPIMLVQVERTGNDQREAGRVHAQDVKDWLLRAGYDESEVAVKTAETNDLRQPENQNLLSPYNRVRVIITKQALQEGWDCPFAYILCSLAASSNKKAMTQLVGRILRQPHAIKTGIDQLDECHVVTHHSDTAEVVKAVKDGLEKDGLGDLVLKLESGGVSKTHKVARPIGRRQELQSTRIYLPRVIWADGDQIRDLDYDTDIVSNIDWRDYDPSAVVCRIPDNAHAAERQLQRISISDDGEDVFVGETVLSHRLNTTFDAVYASRVISDFVPNPFVAREIVGRCIEGLQTRGFSDEYIGGISHLIIEELRRDLSVEMDRKSEEFFKRKVQEGVVQFRLRMDGNNWQMPFEVLTDQPEGARQLVNKDGGALQRSLFSPVYEGDLNSDEQDVAVYLDAEDTVEWWHRNVAKSHYPLQGWKRQRVYPDFIFSVRPEGDKRKITVLETKGDHLDNLDTDYKRKLLDTLSENFQWDNHVPVGQLEFVQNNGETVRCVLVLMSEWKSQLPNYLE